MNKTQTTAAGLVLAITGSAMAAFPSFDDLAVGTTYLPGDSFTSDGVLVKLDAFQWANGNWTNGGEARVTTDLWAHGSANELNTNNINARYNFVDTIGAQTSVTLLFGEYGGNINIAVNGDFTNVHNFIDVHGATLGGCSITVLYGGFGNDHGALRIEAGTDDLIEELTIGGQELAVDIDGDDCEISFDGLPVGDEYWHGTTFWTDGVPVDVQTFILSDGTPYTAGRVIVSDAMLACGSGNEILPTNANAAFRFHAISPAENVSFRFFDAAGEGTNNINVAINGDFRNVMNYMDLDEETIGGVYFDVVEGGYGDDCGRVELTGVVNHLVLGGQQDAVDCLEWDWLDDPQDCEPSYEDLNSGDVYVVADGFATGDYHYGVEHFTWSNGTDTYNGYVSVENSGMACSMDNELHYNNATTTIKRLDGRWMKDVSFKFGEYGGNINLEINGVFANFENMLDINGAVIGGVTVTVDWGGTGNDCGQVSLTGDVEYLRMGGQEYWVDCFAAEATDPAVPGDVDGDGDADINDVLAMLAAWGTSDANADLNGDGTVDVNDLLILLAEL